MASSDNLMTMEQPWAFSDSWFSNVLQKSVFSQEPEMEINPVQTSAGSGRTISGGSDENETTGSNRRSKVGHVSGKITKRKSRASRSNTTTYITADVDNFRHMVQQVTGVRFGSDGQLAVTHVLKLEPQGVSNRLQPVSCLPTFDTSAFLLDHVSQQSMDPTSTMLPTPPSDVVVDGGSCGFDFSTFSGFPTLESFMENNVV
ncbi:hypothetical protein K7X08_007657 [Anisodus acutangulus]|uniref:VQ domain-containing protein n=1 Tax=Anisodus acutangulus TaxID=402998 RepID=A0A9Q1R056_9SOLA|nr:hypothetical protein K7X08_007657 [Anisodus acutangulus]